jgi:hypothetical protein
MTGGAELIAEKRRERGAANRWGRGVRGGRTGERGGLGQKRPSRWGFPFF